MTQNSRKGRRIAERRILGYHLRRRSSSPAFEELSQVPNYPYHRSPRLFLRVLLTNVVYFWLGGKTGDSVKICLQHWRFLYRFSLWLFWGAPIIPYVAILAVHPTACAPENDRQSKQNMGRKDGSATNLDQDETFGPLRTDKWRCFSRLRASDPSAANDLRKLFINNRI